MHGHSGKTGKFELQLDDEDDGEGKPEENRRDQITLDSLIEPKLIT